MRSTRPGPIARGAAAARTAVLAPFLLAAAAAWSACGPAPTGPDVEVEVPDGSGALAIGTRLARAGLVDHPRLFAAYVKMRGSERRLKAGRYRFAPDASWDQILDAVERGAVVTVPVTVPECFTLREIAPRVADISGVPPDSVLRLARDGTVARDLGVPGPHLEGYLYPETYRFSEGTPPVDVLGTMVERYRSFWGARERARADSLGLSEREVTTLASIVEAEARVAEERPVIAGVYLNRIERGMLLQADPTVQYALGEPRERLLYAHIDSVADDPYNTYTNPGLPPGPICSPSEASLDAVLHPADVPYLFFVASPDGRHVFTETEREHINAKNRLRREWNR